MKNSIIICTFNRAILLNLLLSDLVEQKKNLQDTEVVVVNNNSIDNTSEIIKSFETELSIKECFEIRQGISFARNKGVKVSKGDNLIFLDDDVRLCEGLVTEYLHAFQQFTDMVYFGGKITPYWPEGKPDWVKDENLPLLRGIFGSHDYGNTEKQYRNNMDYPFGASFAIRKCVIGDIGFFNVKLSRGEETDLIQRAINFGYKGIYLGKACCFHAVDLNKLTLASIYKTGKLIGKANSEIFDNTKISPTNKVLEIISYLIKGIIQLLKGRGDRFRQCLINCSMLLGTR